MISKTMVLLSTLLYAASAFSQDRDRQLKPAKDSVSTPRRAIAEAADKLAIIRPLNIEFAQAAPYNFTSKRGNTSVPEGKVNSFNQARISANVNFIKTKSWLMGATVGYRLTNSETSLVDPTTGFIKNIDDRFSYLFSSLNASYFSTLFNKRTIYSSSFVVDGSEKHFERMKGLVSGVMVLKANKTTKMIAGAVINIDPSAQTPVVPIFTYEHKFKNGLIADVTLPRSIYMRKYVFNSGRISLGTELDRTSFYLYNLDGTSQRYEYRQLDINSGLIYEHAVGSFVVTGKTGMKYSPSGRLFRKEDNFKDAVYETKPDPTFYFNVGISFNPFTLLGKK